MNDGGIALRKLLMLIGLSALLLSGALSVQAQIPGVSGGTQPAETAALPENPTPEQVREMVSRLSDEQVRALLLQRLDAVAASGSGNAESGSLIDFLGRAASDVAESVTDAVERLPTLGRSQSRAFARFAEERGAGGVFRFFALLAFGVGAGLAAAWLANRIAGRWRDRIQAATGREGLKEIVRILGLRLLMDMAGLLVFALVSRTVLGILMTDVDREIARLFVTSLIVLPMGMSAVVSFLIAPRRPELRLVNTDDETARFLHRRQIIFALIVGFQYLIIEFNRVHGVPVGETRIGFWLNLWVLSYVAWASWRARRGLRMMMRGGDEELGPIERRVADNFPYMVIALCALTWLLVEILTGQGMFELVADGQAYVTLFILIMCPTLDTMVRGLVRHLTPPMKGEGVVAEEAFAATRRSYVRIGRAITFAIVIILIAQIWQIDFRNLASAGFGARAAASIVQVLVVLGVGFVVYEVVTLWINRKLANEQTALGIDLNSEEVGAEGGGAGGSRLSTVLPLLRWTSQAAIVTITLLLALGNLGLDITPLLAGAGIVGLAIGFGAQKLVADIVSGIFFLIDDAFRTGEYVEIESTVGTVEKISIRSLQLRHHRGSIHTIPFGAVPKITNYSRDWVIMKLKFTVPFETDLKKVKNIFKQIGKELSQIPEFEGDLIQTFKSQGVLEVDDVGIVVRGKFMAKPGTQFTIRKFIYDRVQKLFDENGVQFARREVRVRVNGGSDDETVPQLTEEQKRQIAAAASDQAGSDGSASGGSGAA
ncbi:MULTISPECIES: mechanosensitive ion channel family protein [unclassified Minwuia]|uniref:mechanosensitive ion channel family protein n=1 Tax=unclassified Minwuia TaxID=2618799 RepID=UPI00247973C9|nr:MULTISPECIES: mechanosensitive ion channel family protein [unclassified Minwuia]